METLQLNKKKDSSNRTISGIMYRMEVGDECSWSITQTASVRTIASQMGMTYERVYKTKTNRSTKEITVRRVE